MDMKILGNMAKALNRPAVYLQGLQKRFELPVLKGANHSIPIFSSCRRAPCPRTAQIDFKRFDDKEQGKDRVWEGH